MSQSVNQLKYDANAENEVHDLRSFTDMGVNVVSPIATFPEEVALGVVSVLSQVVKRGHSMATNTQSDSDGIVMAQRFEEGDVLMTAAPFAGYAADRYLMDFYDSRERDICSRMHMHTGMRFVRIMTGPHSRVRISALSPIHVSERAPGCDIPLAQFEDKITDEEGSPVRRYNLIVPPCSWVDMQVPRGTAHQFNAFGRHAVIDTIHPEESIELLRERANKINMMAQTIFLEKEQPPASTCLINDGRPPQE
jgi:hypothetical protein